MGSMDLCTSRYHWDRAALRRFHRLARNTSHLRDPYRARHPVLSTYRLRGHRKVLRLGRYRAHHRDPNRGRHPDQSRAHHLDQSNKVLPVPSNLCIGRRRFSAKVLRPLQQQVQGQLTRTSWITPQVVTASSSQRDLWKFQLSAWRRGCIKDLLPVRRITRAEIGSTPARPTGPRGCAGLISGIAQHEVGATRSSAGREWLFYPWGGTKALGAPCLRSLWIEQR